METANPFSGFRTCGGPPRLLLLTLFLLFVQVVFHLILAGVLKGTGVTPLSYEEFIPAHLASLWLCWAILDGAGAGWRAALAEWNRGLAADLKKAALYFGGYAGLLAAMAVVLLAAYLLSGEGLERFMAPLTRKTGGENAALAAASFSGGRFALVLLDACVLAPLAEELFFRRIVFVSLRARGFWYAALLSSLLFALFHGAAFLMTLPVGLYFAWVYERERRLPVVIALHGLVNLFAVLFKTFA